MAADTAAVITNGPVRLPASGLRAVGWVVCLILLIAPISWIAALSPLFSFETPWAERPVLTFVALLVVCGLSAPLMVALLHAAPLRGQHAVWLFLVGIALRVLLFPSTPILEDDWHRYLWDGAVIAQGGDPYRFAPAEGLARDAFGELHAPTDDIALEKLRALGSLDPRFPERVNYPYLTTIYPPAVQGAFALAAAIQPFSLSAWRLVIGAADVATFALLAIALAAFGRPSVWALLYWLNPIVIVQTYVASHMDVLIGPFLIGAILLMRRGAPLLSGAALAGAVGVKIWPLVLVPLFMRASGGMRSAALFASAALGFSAIFLLPMLTGLGEARSGLAAYSENWTRNAFLFTIVESVIGKFAAEPGFLSRIVCAGVVVVAAVYASFRHGAGPQALPALAFGVIAILFFLSPTGYPWYAIWLMLLAPFAPGYGIALLSVTLPLYALRFPNPLTDGEPGLIILALQFLPPLALAAWEARGWLRN